ncbi:MAG: efflux RND transporter periplasmic adaptor subunit [Gemmatimonadota bacterium]
MRTRHAALGALALGLALGAARAAHAQDRPPAPVIVSEVLEQEARGEIALVGTVQPRRASLVASETDGKVVARLRDPGAAVRRGDVIYRLANDQLQASLVEALADVRLRRFRFQQSSELLRQEAVADDDLRASEYELDRARAKLQDLESRLEDLTIRAPFDGHLVELRAEVGEWVTRGQAVARAICTDTVWVYAEVPESYVAALRVGDGAEVVADALGTTSRPGRIAAVLAQGSSEARTFPVAVELLNGDGQLRAGMSAHVTFATRRAGTSILVHKDALVSDPRGSAVFVVVDGTAARRPVRAGLAYSGYVAVEGEVTAGDLVVVRGNERLQDGQPIRVVRKQQ